MEANAATHYLIERFGMPKVQEVLLHLKARQTIAAAMQDRLLLSYDHFQQQWADSLGSTLGPAEFLIHYRKRRPMAYGSLSNNGTPRRNRLREGLNIWLIRRFLNAV